MAIDRRRLLASGALLGLAAAAPVMAQRGPARSSAPVIDVHTHMFSPRWMEAVNASDNETFRLGPGNSLLYKGVGMGRVSAPMLDYDMRIRDMDAAGVDIALISLTAPNVFWGTRRQSAEAARVTNDDFMAAQQSYDGRIRWMANLPWQHADDAIAELRRARANGAIGVATLTNIAGEPLTLPKFRRIWQEIEAMELPVFIHPTRPNGEDPFMEDHTMINSIGFTTETSMCLARMIYEGFFDDLPRIKVIASHGGGGFPFLLGRFDIMWERLNAGKTELPPSSYARRIYFDSIVFDQATLDFIIAQVGYDRVLYGSDYPFTIGDMSGHLARVDALAPGQRDAVRSGNALSIFDL